jgi:hypothetical protein
LKMEILLLLLMMRRMRAMRMKVPVRPTPALQWTSGMLFYLMAVRN